jgi:tellurite resistance protein
MALVPIRISAGLGAVALAALFPLVALLFLSLLVVFSLGLIAVVFVARESFRQPHRVPCKTCDYEPLEDANLCPKCQTAVLTAVDSHFERRGRLLLAVAGCVARVDGVLHAAEQKEIEAIAEEYGLGPIKLGDKEDIAGLLEQVAKTTVLPETSVQVMKIAVAVTAADRSAHPTELEFLGSLAAALGLDSSDTERYLEAARKRAVSESLGQQARSKFSSLVSYLDRPATAP